MTGMHFQRKRSERGASLIMLVSIIGLAFIVTVAGFLVAASDSQDTARLASAKVDIATREDALMREILQQTATGMLPGTDGFTGPILTWTQIMTNAVNNLHATSYVDPAELAALQAAGAIPANVTLANTGDTGGTLLGIFQGYNNEVPYGGTSGLANLVPVNAALAAVEPPLMNWSAERDFNGGDRFDHSSGVLSRFAVHRGSGASPHGFVSIETLGANPLSKYPVRIQKSR